MPFDKVMTLPVAKSEHEENRRPGVDKLAPDAHVLVVDDDGQIRTLIARFLRQNGYRVSTARDAREMREVMAAGLVDLIILDVMLPGTSGLDLCRELRSRSTIPIIMLTAKGEETDRIVGLELGADDYLPKPFNPRELLARIRAVLRRATASSEGPATPRDNRGFAFAGWTLDTLRRELISPDRVVIDLSSGEYDLLLAFVEHPQRILTRDHLLDLARNRAPLGFDRSIDVQVSRLRRKLDSEDTETSLIKTVRGAGYLFTPAVKRT